MHPALLPEARPVCQIAPCEQDYCPLTGKECHRTFPWRKTVLGVLAITEPKKDGRGRR
jgi:hypothetical protein